VPDRIDPATSGPTSARRALERRRGDADANALALTALARASGIPARPVSGLLLADGRFYLHSWVELYLGEWVEVDPALGQFPVDARHIRLLAGGRARLDIMQDLVAGLRLSIPSTPGPK
ncbi:MAG: transglutaminase-like domain-containing protein, partial [Gemmatimonadales bacterium]